SITRSQPVITCRRLGISKDLRRGGGLYCLLTVLLPVSLGTVLWMAVHSTAIHSSVITVKHPSKTLPAHS
ncbi:unnamed protein product, partial [Staurois parvus]